MLPENKPKKKDVTPRVFFIWGDAMSGKTYLARQFPDPILLNTDGNYIKVDTPSVYITDYKQLLLTLKELEEQNGKVFKTIIIDLVEDVRRMISKQVCTKYNEETLGENKKIRGTDWVVDKTMWYDFIHYTTHLINYNIVFTCHVMDDTDPIDGTKQIVPMLKKKDLDVLEGRCDFSIRTSKLGSKYIARITSKRNGLTKDDVKDEKIKKILNYVGGIENE